jgi:hypothetical protein
VCCVLCAVCVCCVLCVVSCELCVLLYVLYVAECAGRRQMKDVARISSRAVQFSASRSCVIR